MKHDHNTTMETIMEIIISQGPDAMAQIFTSLFNYAMRIEREQYLDAKSHERTDTRQGYANGFKPRRIDTNIGTLQLDIPKTRGCETPFYPEALERRSRSSRALMMTIAEMYIKGVSTRDVEDVLQQFGLKNISSTQVSRTVKMLDEELNLWRNRPLGIYPYIILDARYEKVRHEGIVHDMAILIAIGVNEDGRREILGISSSLSEAEVHWRQFLDSLIARGLHGVNYIVSDAHHGLINARKAVFGGALWQRCQFHLAQNAIHHAPNHKVKQAIGEELRMIWNASNLDEALDKHKQLCQSYEDKHPKFASWLANNILEGLTVFQLPKKHQKKMRTSNPIERAVMQEIKRRTRKVRIFPNEESALRLITAILIDIDENWQTSRQKWINWNDKNDNQYQNSRIYIKNVA
jgi:putative transposase